MKKSLIYPPVEEMMGLPKHPGVYALWEGTTCVYVGSSNHVFYRISSHPHLGKFDSITFRRVPEVELLKWEKLWCDDLKPTLNKATPCRPAKRRRYAWRWMPKKQGWTRIYPMEIRKWRKCGACIAVEKFDPALHYADENGKRELRLYYYRSKKRTTPQEAA